MRGGLRWHLMPQDCPPWHAVHRQTRRWMAAGVFAAIVRDLRELPRLLQGRTPTPTAAILDSRTLQSTPESGGRAGYDGAKHTKGSKVHLAVDALGQLPALHVTPADVQERSRVGILAEALQAAAGRSVDLAFVDQSSTGARATAAADADGIHLEAVRLPNANLGFVWLPRRWVVERGVAWTGRFRRLARDYERLHTSLERVDSPAFALPVLRAALPFLALM